MMDGLELDGSALIVGRTILGSPVMPSLVFSRTCQIFTLYSLLVLRLRLCNPYFRAQGISNVQLSSAQPHASAPTDLREVITSSRATLRTLTRTDGWADGNGKGVFISPSLSSAATVPATNRHRRIRETEWFLHWIFINIYTVALPWFGFRFAR